MMLRINKLPVKKISHHLKLFLEPYIFALYYQELNHFRNIQDNVPFTLYFNYHKTKLHMFQPFFLSQDLIQVNEQFL